MDGVTRSVGFSADGQDLQARTTLPDGAGPEVVLLDTLPLPFSGSSVFIGGRTRLPWMARSVLAGVAAELSVRLVESVGESLRPRQPRRLWRRRAAPPPQTILDVRSLVNLRGAKGGALQAAYGAAIGLLHGSLRRRNCEPIPSEVTGLTLAAATLTLPPLLGRCPPAWRWPMRELGIVATTHLLHTLTLGGVHEGTRHLQTGDWTARLFD